MIRRRKALSYIALLGVIILGLMNLWVELHVEITTGDNNSDELVKQLMNALPINNNCDRTTSTDSPSDDFQPRDDKLPQKCKIPVLDPYHPDIKKSIKRWTVPECRYPDLSEVTDDGLLQIRYKEGVTEAKFCYIQRINDDRQKYTSWEMFFDKNKNIDKAIKLTDNFVKVSITANNRRVYIEYHMYPVRNEQGGEVTLQRDPNKLNLVFIMLDSVSHSTAKRYLNNTLKKMRASKSTIMMNGHTIVGDGTTAQISAMFAGGLERDLPEARKGFPNSGYVDRWPFLFREFENLGYATLYSEDSPSLATFNYRVKGWSKPPTTKYTRNFWLAASPYISRLNKQSIKCSSIINFIHLKRFMKVYQDTPTFAYLVLSTLTHGSSPYVQLIDNDLVRLLEHFESTKQNENTITVIFGDHGERSSSYRATITGKLEERLPFMSFTFPPWFPKKYPEQFTNFQRNSKVLTSHFDVYATLQHLKNFPQNNYTHKYGSSLFEDVTLMNRTCPQVGVLEHWCSCLDYQGLKVDDALVIKAANSIITSINAMNSKIEELCETLKLDKVVRAGIIKPSDRVQKFSKTFRNGKCDECGVKENKADFKLINYEVVFEVLPSGGRYEATTVYNKVTGVFTPSEGVSRINMYRNQPHCIKKTFPHLRAFCYCKKQLDS